MPNIERDKEFSAPQSAVYKAIVDFAGYKDFLPEVTGVTLEPGGSPTKQLVTFEIEVVKKFRYTLEFTMKPNEEVRWKLVKSDFFKQNEGAWTLTPSGEGKTAVRYQLDIGFGFMVPGWIVKKLTETNLPKMFESYEARAKSLA